jgi:hypothetical protein
MTLLQHTGNTDNAGATSVAKAFAAAVTAGSLLVCIVNSGGSFAATPVTDSNGNTWHQVGTTNGPNADSQIMAMFYAWNANAGATTVTVHWVSTGNDTFSILEFSGILASSDPLDVQNTLKTGSTATGANAITSNSVTPGTANGLAIAAMSDTSGTAPTTTAGTGWTDGDNQPGINAATASVDVEFKVLSGTPATSATWTISVAAHNYQALIAVFKPAAAVPTMGYLRRNRLRPRPFGPPAAARRR